MDAVQEIRDAFSTSERFLVSLEQYLVPIIESYVENHGYTSKHRVKSLASVAAKLQQGRYESWSDLDDLVGFTVVVPTQSHVAGVEKWLADTFEFSKKSDHSTVPKPPETFRFDTMRWYGRIRQSSVVSPLDAVLRQFQFEVQVKTVFEDAWSVATHDLVYKGDDPTWNRARLASQLKAAIEQIDVLVDHFETSAAQLRSSPHRQTDAVTRAKETLTSLFEDDLIDPALRPDSWTSLVNNLWTLSTKQRTPDGESFRSPEGVFRKIVKEFDEAIRSGDFEPLLSATLFDAIVARAVSSGQASIDDFFYVNSEALLEAFGLSAAKPIDLRLALDEPQEHVDDSGTH